MTNAVGGLKRGVYREKKQWSGVFIAKKWRFLHFSFAIFKDIILVLTTLQFHPMLYHTYTQSQLCTINYFSAKHSYGMGKIRIIIYVKSVK